MVGRPNAGVSVDLKTIASLNRAARGASPAPVVRAAPAAPPPAPKPAAPPALPVLVVSPGYRYGDDETWVPAPGKVEFRFPAGDPGEFIRKVLADCGMRWSRGARAWYGPDAVGAAALDQLDGQVRAVEATDRAAALAETARSAPPRAERNGQRGPSKLDVLAEQVRLLTEALRQRQGG